MTNLVITGSEGSVSSAAYMAGKIFAQLQSAKTFPYVEMCVYYCSTYYKAVRDGGGGGVHVL